MDFERGSPSRSRSCFSMLFGLIRTRTRENRDGSEDHDGVEDIHLFQVAGCSYAAFDGLKGYLLPPSQSVAGPRPDIPVTKDWIMSTIRHFEECDDVYQRNFLEGLVIINTSQRENPPNPECQLHLSALGNKWTYLAPGRSRVNQLSPGPHYLHEGLLRPAYRLYDDTQLCFLAALKPQDSTSEVFKQLRITAIQYQALGVAVPSRVAGPDEDNHSGLAQSRIAVKDLYHLRGMKTSLCNSDYYKLSTPSHETADVVRLLTIAGGQILGLTKLSSMIAREEPLEAVDFQTAFNPRGDGYQSPAGSSSGSAAAVASYDWLDCALGTDTSGSGRRPALVNGVYQFRPTHSKICLDGMVPTFLQFDTPCVFARNLHMLESVLRAWLPCNESPLITSETQFEMIYPLDYFPVQNMQQMQLLESFMDDMTTHLAAQVKIVSIQELWEDSPPKGVSERLSEFLQDVVPRTYFYSYYHSTDAFRSEFTQKYGRRPYVIPFVRERWDAGASVSDEENVDALHRLELYREWLLEHIFRSKKTIMMLPIANVEPNYRDIASESPAILPSTDQLYLPPILGSPDVVVPIGEVSYMSRVTEREEFLPVAVNLVASPGDDFWLLNILKETLARSGRREDICTGSRIFQKPLENASGTFTLSSDSSSDESVAKP
ncbi:hypothetical protein PG988_001794 [Apiospora saccharicola]